MSEGRRVVPVDAAVGSVSELPDAEAVHRLALSFLTAWDLVLEPQSPRLVVTSRLISETGPWETPELGGTNAYAIGCGRIVGGTNNDHPANGPDMAAWTAKHPASWPIIAPLAAISQTVAERSGGTRKVVTPVVLHSARLAGRTFSTATGPTVLPVWRFAVAGSMVRVDLLAIPRDRIVVSTDVPGIGHWADRDPSRTVHAATQQTLELTFNAEAVRNHRNDPVTYGPSFRVAVVESKTAVAVLVHRTAGPPAAPITPGRRGYKPQPTTIRMTLPSPLGDRIVIDGQEGRALPRI